MEVNPGKPGFVVEGKMVTESEVTVKTLKAAKIRMAAGLGVNLEMAEAKPIVEYLEKVEGKTNMVGLQIRGKMGNKMMKRLCDMITGMKMKKLRLRVDSPI